jgi:superfamily II DNA or RNA helicase
MILSMINTTNLLKYQIPHVKRLVDSLHLNGYAADLSDTGTGKTFCASAVAREMNCPVFVVCPKPVLPSWKETLAKFGVKPIAIRNYESLIRGTRKSYYTSWDKEEVTRKGKVFKEEVLRFNKRVPSNALFIFDEVHRCKATDSINSELLMTIRDQGFKCLKVSASAATNPVEMKAFGYVARLHNFKDGNDFKRGFAAQYGAQWTGKFGQMVFDPMSEEARVGMYALNKYLYKTQKCASRIRIKDLGNQFPKNKTMADKLDCGSNTGKINKVYDIMEYELAMLEEDSARYSDHIFSIMMRARRQSELLKVPTFVDAVEEHIRDGKSVAIFLNFDDSITACVDRLQKKFGTKTSIRSNGEIKIGCIKGGQTDKQREEVRAGFQDDEYQIVVCNIAAGGTGISLHDLNGDRARVSLISPNYSAIQLLQALGRVWRAGAKTPSQQHIIFAADTIEERACERVQARLNNLAVLNDGDMRSGIKFWSEGMDAIDWSKASFKQKVAA